MYIIEYIYILNILNIYWIYIIDYLCENVNYWLYIKNDFLNFYYGKR